MQIIKNPLDEKIVTVKELKKIAVIRIKKNHIEVMSFRFNHLINYGDFIDFKDDNSLPVTMDREFLRGKLIFNFEGDNAKFYTLEI